MDIRLYWEKVYWALAKRVFKRKQKTYEDWLAKGYTNQPLVSFIIESHNKSVGVKRIVSELREYPNAEIDENVMYDKTIRFANGEYIVLMQDDDEITDLDWVDKGVSYFKKYPDMVILGGLNGLEFVTDDKEKWGYVDLYKDDRLRDKDFYFVHAVNRAPMLLNKRLFLDHLGHIDFSFAPFQCDDCELCLRAWLCGLKVGWYNAGFKSMIAGGMRIWNKGLMGFQEIKNRGKLYEMYKFSSSKVSELVEVANKQLKS